jgi:hypothetical protein
LDARAPKTVLACLIVCGPFAKLFDIDTKDALTPEAAA